MFYIQFSKTNVLIGRIVPGEFRIMTTTHGRAILLCMNFLLHDKMAADGKSL